MPEQTLQQRFYESIERSTGRSIDYLINTPIDIQRLDLEKERGKKIVWAGTRYIEINIPGVLCERIAILERFILSRYTVD
jgi:hypothetical protein